MEELVDCRRCHDNRYGGHDSVDRPLIPPLCVGNTEQCKADRPLDRNRCEAEHGLHDEPPLFGISTHVTISKGGSDDLRTLQSLFAALRAPNPSCRHQ
jgi:hypothetical protein